MHKKLYTLHRELEQKYTVLTQCLDKQGHPNATELKAVALNKLRIDQRLDAQSRDGLAGRTVHVYKSGELIGIVRHCRVEDFTATVCFTLKERNDDNTIVSSIAVSSDMDLFVEDPNA